MKRFLIWTLSILIFLFILTESILPALVMHSSFEDAFVELLDEQIPSIFLYGIKPFVRLTAMIKYSVNPWTMRPKSAITRLHGRPALLMHTKKDMQVRYANLDRIIKYAPYQVDTMTRNVDEHFFTPDFFAPQTDTVYCRKIMGFIASVGRSVQADDVL